METPDVAAAAAVGTAGDGSQGNHQLRLELCSLLMNHFLYDRGFLPEPFPVLCEALAAGPSSSSLFSGHGHDHGEASEPASAVAMRRRWGHGEGAASAVLGLSGRRLRQWVETYSALMASLSQLPVAVAQFAIVVGPTPIAPREVVLVSLEGSLPPNAAVRRANQLKRLLLRALIEASSDSPPSVSKSPLHLGVALEGAALETNQLPLDFLAGFVARPNFVLKASPRVRKCSIAVDLGSGTVSTEATAPASTSSAAILLASPRAGSLWFFSKSAIKKPK